MLSLGFSLLSTLHPTRSFGFEEGVVKSKSLFDLRIGREAKNQHKTKQKQNHPFFATADTGKPRLGSGIQER